MSMSKKHFEALAAALKDMQPQYEDFGHPHGGMDKAEAQWAMDIESVADVCASFNPNFDRTRFLKACGVGEGK